MKKVVFVCLALILTLSIAVIGCAPKATTPGAAPNTKPATVYRWEPATWIGEGPQYIWLEYLADDLNAFSDGRFSVVPSQPGAICPVDQQAEAVGSGLTAAMAPAGTYYGGKIPMVGLYGAGIGSPTYHDCKVAYKLFQDGAAQKMLFADFEELFSVACVDDYLGAQDITMVSNKPIDSVAALKGIKFRCGDEAIAGPLTAFGAPTTWIPASETYVALSTNVFDAATMGSAADDLSLSFNEVTKWWLRSPALMSLCEMPFMVNKDVWSGLPQDLKDLVRLSLNDAFYKAQVEGDYAIDQAWETVVKGGITLVYWSNEDANKWVAAQFEWAKKYTDTDADSAAFMKIINDYRKFKGYD